MEQNDLPKKNPLSLQLDLSKFSAASFERAESMIHQIPAGVWFHLSKRKNDFKIIPRTNEDSYVPIG